MLATYKPETPPIGWRDWMGVVLVQDGLLYLNTRFVDGDVENIILHEGETYAPAGWVISNATEPGLARECADSVFSIATQLK